MSASGKNGSRQKDRHLGQIAVRVLIRIDVALCLAIVAALLVATPR